MTIGHDPKVPSHRGDDEEGAETDERHDKRPEGPTTESGGTAEEETAPEKKDDR